MIEYVTNLKSFWDEDLAGHTYVRKVPFEAKNFDHLDRQYYNRDFLFQSFNEELPNSGVEFLSALGVSSGSVGWMCIVPNLILPTHKDTFYTLREKFNVDISRCMRYLIFLEDWKFGQLAVFENKIITDWKKGDVWVFDSTEMHYAVNASNSLFHTCQVSTFK